MRIYVCGGPEQAGWANAMLADLATALRSGGVESESVSFSSDAAVGFADAVRRRVARGERVCLFSINRSPLPAGRAVPGLTRFVWMVDHPARHHAWIPETDDGTVLGVVDRAQLETLRRVFSTPARTVFLPHAGPEPAAAPPAMAERDIDMLFAGDLRVDPSPESAVGHFLSSPVVKDIFVRAATRCIEDREDCLIAVVAACVDFGVDPADIARPQLYRMATAAEACAQSHFRHACLGSVTAGRVHVVGPVNPARFANRDRLVFHGPTEFPEVLALMDRSRLVLNLVPKFADGSHERFAYALSRGAVVASTPSRFLEDDFADGEAAFYLRDKKPALDALIAIARKDAARLGRMQAAGRDVYAARHTWKARLPVLLAALEAAA